MPGDRLRRRYSRFLGPDPRRDVDDELAFHFAMRVEEFEHAGMSRQAAEAAARERFGNVDSIRHECVDLSQRRQARRHRRFHMDALRQDIKFALRTIAGNRSFAAAIVLTMALGIAANTVVFSVAYGVLLRPLPFRDADRLVRLWSKNDERQLEFFSISPADFASWREQNRVFSQMGAFDRQRDAILTRGGEPQSVEVAAVSPDIFAVLGASAARGRTLLADDARQGAPSVAVISYYLWNSRFGADSTLVGSQILLNGRRVTVAGVMPRRFFVPGTSAEIWTPLTLAGASDDHSFRFLRVLGRLAPGVEVERARRELDMIAGRLAQESPVTNKGWSVNIVPITEWLAGEQFRRALFVLLGVVGAVLLIACANAANLQLARAAARRREIALRAALGATRARVVTQLLTESTLLAVIGGVVGLALARAGLGVLRSMGAETIPRLEDVRLDGPVLAFTVLVALGGGILFGLLPALRASRPDVGEVLKDSGRGTGRSSVGGTMRAVLVVSQVSLSLVLLISAGLLLRSFARLQAVPLGFSTDGVAAIPLALPEASYPDAGRAWTFYEALMERLARTPNVDRVAAVNSPPFAGPNTGTVFLREGEPVPTRERAPDADLRLITPGYLRTLGIPLLRGRDLLDTDRQGSPPVALISESMAKRYWPGEDAVGRRVRIGDLQQGPMYTIVGVVADVRYQSLEEPEIRPMMYLSAFVNPRPSTILVVQASDMSSLAAGVRRAVAELDPALPPPNVLIIRELVERRLSTSRFVATLLSIFAGAALVLAAIGIYGVMSYLVRLRTQELGIRVALGAPVRSLVAGVVGGALRLAAIGIVIGLVAALGVTRWLGSLLFGVGATDPLTFATIAALLIVVATVASLVPARRAARADPSVALRDA
jgi:predicted permease